MANVRRRHPLFRPWRNGHDGGQAASSSIAQEACGRCSGRHDRLLRWCPCAAISEFRSDAGWPRRGAGNDRRTQFRSLPELRPAAGKQSLTRYTARTPTSRPATDLYCRYGRSNPLQVSANPIFQRAVTKLDFIKMQSIDLNGPQEWVAMVPAQEKATVQGQGHGEENNPSGNVFCRRCRHGGEHCDNGIGRAAWWPCPKAWRIAARPLHDHEPSDHRAHCLCQIL